MIGRMVYTGWHMIDWSTKKALIIPGVVAIAGIAFVVYMFGQSPKPSPIVEVQERGPVISDDIEEVAEEVVVTPTISRQSGVFANGQPYALYQTDDFEVIFPDWQYVSGTSPELNEPALVFVSNEGCNVVVRPVRLAPGITYREFVENTIREAESYQPVYARKEVTDTTAYIDADITFGDGTIRNVSSNYLTRRGVSYGVAFVSEKSNFDRACAPYLDEVLQSVKVK